MKNTVWKFHVTTNNNTYYATSLQAAKSFCKKNDLVVHHYWYHIPVLTERKSAVKCGRGIYCIINPN